MEDVITTEKLEGQEDLSQEKTEIKEESIEDLKKKYKDLESNSERGVQKVLSEKKLLEEIIDSSKVVGKDPAKMIEIYYAKPELAKKLLDTYYEGMDFDEFKSRMGLEDDGKLYLESMAAKKAETIVLQRDIKSKINEFVKEMGYDDATSKVFNTELEDIVEGKKLSLDNLTKYLIMSHNYIKREEFGQLKDAKKQEAIAKQMASQSATGGEKAKSAGNSVTERAKSISEFVKNLKY